MSKIVYDQPVVDLRTEVSATEHVTHTAYRKTSVTLHHNAGINTLEQVVKTWETREASTQFGVDKTGRVGQFTEVTDYAWAVGNTQGNMSSISIEMSNSALSPSWTVADVTWQNAARLAGWLFAKVIGERPSSSNLFYHHHWYSTACAGPYMDKIYNQVLAAAQTSYDYFTVTPKPPVTKPKLHRTFPLQSGYFGDINGPDESHGGANSWERPYIEALQLRLIVTKSVTGVEPSWADGRFEAPTTTAVKRYQASHGLVVDGKVGLKTWNSLFTYK